MIIIIGCCAAALVVASVRTPSKTSALLTRDLNDSKPIVRVNAILKIQVLWRSRLVSMETACFLIKFITGSLLYNYLEP